MNKIRKKLKKLGKKVGLKYFNKNMGKEAILRYENSFFLKPYIAFKTPTKENKSIMCFADTLRNIIASGKIYHTPKGDIGPEEALIAFLKWEIERLPRPGAIKRIK